MSKTWKTLSEFQNSLTWVDRYCQCLHSSTLKSPSNRQLTLCALNCI